MSLKSVAHSRVHIVSSPFGSMSLLKFFKPRRPSESSSVCGDAPSSAPQSSDSLSLSSQDVGAVAEVCEPVQPPTVSPCTGQRHATLGQRTTAPTVSLRYCVGNSPIPVFKLDDIGDRVHVTSVSDDGGENANADDAERVFFELHSKRSKWFVDAFGVCPQQTVTYQRLKTAIAETFGKHSKGQWCVSKDSTPIKSRQCTSIPFDGVTINMLQSRKVICLEASVQSLTWLATSVHAEFDHTTSGSGEPGLICHGTVVDEEADDDDDDESNAADDVIANAIANPFDNNAMCELASHNVNWQPSRRVLLCCGERGHTKHARKVKVHFNLKKRKNMVTISSSRTCIGARRRLCAWRWHCLLPAIRPLPITTRSWPPLPK
jgi:hypothetical protein